MRLLNELLIRGQSPEVTAFLQRLEATLTNGWRRDRELEARFQGVNGNGNGGFCFCCADAPGRPAAALWLQARGPEEWRVSNIVPLDRRALSDEEYNRILAEFERFLEPLSRGGPVRSEILPARTQLQDDLSPEAWRLLQAFSTAANRTALSAADRQRWQQFLLQAHREESILDPTHLESWLASEGWPREMQAELARAYEDGRRLLWSYDEEYRR